MADNCWLSRVPNLPEAPRASTAFGSPLVVHRKPPQTEIACMFLAHDTFYQDSSLDGAPVACVLIPGKDEERQLESPWSNRVDGHVDAVCGPTFWAVVKCYILLATDLLSKATRPKR